MYKIREVDALDNDIADTLQEMNMTMGCFPRLKSWEIDNGYWWLATVDDEPAAFAGLVPSRQFTNAGYLNRAGVLRQYRGNKLQCRLMRVRLAKAKALGWSHVVSDCTSNIHSANNFIECGFRFYQPRNPWGLHNAIYWIKELQ